MNKTKITLAAIGGVIGLAVAALGVLTVLAFMDRSAAFEGDEENAGLEATVSRAATLMGKKPYPSRENKALLEKNFQKVDDWCSDIRREVAKGDWRAEPGCTPAQFKEQIAREAKTIAAVAGPGGTPVFKADFGFGPFREYLADKMPSADELKRLQRQWNDITSLIDVFVTNGVMKVTDLEVLEQKASSEERDARPAKSARKGKAVVADVPRPSVETYRFTFVARPEAFVGIVRKLSFQDRFTIIDGFDLVRERDAIAEALGGDVKKTAAAAVGGRRSRRRAAASEEVKVETEEQKDDGIVFDPETDSAFKVSLTVAVYDFRTLEEDEKGASK